MNRNAEWCQRCIEAVYLPPLSDEEIESDCLQYVIASLEYEGEIESK